MDAGKWDAAPWCTGIVPELLPPFRLLDLFRGVRIYVHAVPRRPVEIENAAEEEGGPDDQPE